MIAALIGILLQQATASPPERSPVLPVPSPDARRIVTALNVARQISFSVSTLAPAFAQQLVAALATSDQFRSVLATKEGRARVLAVAQEEYERSFSSHLPELVDAVARDYDARLSTADLHALAAFLSAGAGARWAAVVADLQRSASGAGARIGALAGEEAYVAMSKRIIGASQPVKQP